MYWQKLYPNKNTRSYQLLFMYLFIPNNAYMGI